MKKEHITYIRYFTVFNDEVDRRTGPVSAVPRKDEVIVLETDKHGMKWYRVEMVVWAVGKLATEAQVRLMPWLGGRHD